MRHSLDRQKTIQTLNSTVTRKNDNATSTLLREGDLEKEDFNPFFKQQNVED